MFKLKKNPTKMEIPLMPKKEDEHPNKCWCCEVCLCIGCVFRSFCALCGRW